MAGGSLAGGRLILTCDQDLNSYLLAVDPHTGKQVWRTSRDEIPSWSTPTVYEGNGRAELVANGAKFVRGYDPQTGKELWRIGPNSEIATPTAELKRATEMPTVSETREP